MISVARAMALSVLAVVAGCGAGQTDVNVPVAQPTTTATTTVDPSPPKPLDPWRPFVDALVAAGGAMVAAARGEPHDPRWDCDAPAFRDLRTTPDSTREEFRKKGTGEPMLYVVERLELASGTATPGDGASYPTLRGDLIAWPDGKLRWGEVSVERSADLDEFLPIARLPPEFQGPLDALTQKLPTEACSLPTPTLDDLESVPLNPKEKAIAVEELPKIAEEGQKACAALRGASGPWLARARAIGVLFSGAAAEPVALMSELSAPNGHPCLGAVRVK